MTKRLTNPVICLGNVIINFISNCRCKNSKEEGVRILAPNQNDLYCTCDKNILTNQTERGS